MNGMVVILIDETEFDYVHLSKTSYLQYIAVTDYEH